MRRNGEIHDVGGRVRGPEPKVRDGDGEMKAAWARASGIDEQRSTSPLRYRAMRMAGDHDGHRGRDGAVQILDVVNQVKTDSADLNRPRVRNPPRPVPMIVVAPYGEHRRNPFQVLEDTGSSDITGVKDQRSTGERRQGLWTHYPVGIGNKADEGRVGNMNAIKSAVHDHILTEMILIWKRVGC